LREQVGEELAGGEEAEEDLQRARAVLQELRHEGGGGGVGEEALEVVQRHVGVGGAGQQARERGGEVREAVGGEVLGRRGEVGLAAVEVADAPGVEQRAGAVGGGEGGAEVVGEHDGGGPGGQAVDVIQDKRRRSGREWPVIRRFGQPSLRFQRRRL